MSERWTPKRNEVVAVKMTVRQTRQALYLRADYDPRDPLSHRKTAPWRTAAEIEALDAAVETLERIRDMSCVAGYDAGHSGIHAEAVAALAAVQKAREGRA